MSIQSNIWRVSARAGNMEQAIVYRVGPSIQKVFQPRPRMQEELKLASQFTISDRLPIGGGDTRAQEDVRRPPSPGI